MSTIARLTLAEYDRMIECGVFDPGKQRRLEFMRGEIREMTPIGSPHQEVVARLISWSVPMLAQGDARVWVQSSLGFPELESAPEPDIAWVRPRSYWSSRPTAADVLLIIEVADTSLDYDRREKADMYAEAGIADYWIVNLRERVIEVRRDPQAGRYRNVRIYSGDDGLEPLAGANMLLRPSMLWGE